MMLDKEKQLECMANMAGIDFKTLPTVEYVKWIIDTRATNHMTASLDTLFDILQVITAHNGKVHPPNGGVTMVSHTGKCKLGDMTVLKNVLFIPDFKYNLLSVSKITKELNCFVSFILVSTYSRTLPVEP
ncbi:hypothetical protein AABB24_023896 [Solanum stoloniferum]|uniref:Retrovirus-related Pol polyprotein from transposon TNT 1-94-like beta-barrel domain-containing protein n=1 Tax=Solanum stoloniferum TaxID=62892 RepID=A0ABD2SLD4_9SOLN